MTYWTKWEAGSKTGEVAEREIIHRQGSWNQVILVIIINDKQEILIQKRSSNKNVYPNEWDFSVIGHVRAGETLKEGAKQDKYSFPIIKCDDFGHEGILGVIPIGAKIRLDATNKKVQILEKVVK